MPYVLTRGDDSSRGAAESASASTSTAPPKRLRGVTAARPRGHASRGLRGAKRQRRRRLAPIGLPVAETHTKQAQAAPLARQRRAHAGLGPGRRPLRQS